MNKKELLIKLDKMLYEVNIAIVYTSEPTTSAMCGWRSDLKAIIKDVESLET